jgi:hypothetical protein
MNVLGKESPRALPTRGKRLSGRLIQKIYHAL